MEIHYLIVDGESLQVIMMKERTFPNLAMRRERMLMQCGIGM
jgi:hypothetical protein